MFGPIAYNTAWSGLGNRGLGNWHEESPGFQGQDAS